jgi:D-xylonolactonase
MRADAAGRIYVGTLHWGHDGKMERTGSLYLLGLDGGLRVVDEGITLSNGLGFSGDGRTLYFADSAVRRIYAYDVNVTTGALANRRVFVEIGPDEGLPDGLCVDSEDHVWCAHWYGACVVRYTPAGSVDRRIAFPVSQTSSCGFGGADLGDLYVTSASDLWTSSFFPRGFDPAAKPAGGSLFCLRPGATGRAEHVARIRI